MAIGYDQEKAPLAPPADQLPEGESVVAVKSPLLPELPATAARTSGDAPTPATASVRAKLRLCSPDASAPGSKVTFAVTFWRLPSLRLSATGVCTWQAGFCGVVSTQPGNCTRRKR